MNEFYNVNKSVLQARLEVFNYFDIDNNGYINKNEFSLLNNYLNCHLVYTNNNKSIYSLHKVFKIFKINNRKNLNFLDIYKYMKELDINFI